MQSFYSSEITCNKSVFSYSIDSGLTARLAQYRRTTGSKGAAPKQRPGRRERRDMRDMERIDEDSTEAITMAASSRTKRSVWQLKSLAEAIGLEQGRMADSLPDSALHGVECIDSPPHGVDFDSPPHGVDITDSPPNSVDFTDSSLHGVDFADSPPPGVQDNDSPMDHSVSLPHASDSPPHGVVGCDAPPDGLQLPFCTLLPNQLHQSHYKPNSGIKSSEDFKKQPEEYLEVLTVLKNQPGFQPDKFSSLCEPPNSACLLADRCLCHNLEVTNSCDINKHVLDMLISGSRFSCAYCSLLCVETSICNSGNHSDDLQADSDDLDPGVCTLELFYKEEPSEQDLYAPPEEDKRRRPKSIAEYPSSLSEDLVDEEGISFLPSSQNGEGVDDGDDQDDVFVNSCVEETVVLPNDANNNAQLQASGKCTEAEGVTGLRDELKDGIHSSTVGHSVEAELVCEVNAELDIVGDSTAGDATVGDFTSEVSMAEVASTSQQSFQASMRAFSSIEEKKALGSTDFTPHVTMGQIVKRIKVRRRETVEQPKERSFKSMGHVVSNLMQTNYYHHIKKQNSESNEEKETITEMDLDLEAPGLTKRRSRRNFTTNRRHSMHTVNSLKESMLVKPDPLEFLIENTYSDPQRALMAPKCDIIYNRMFSLTLGFVCGVCLCLLLKLTFFFYRTLA